MRTVSPCRWQICRRHRQRYVSVSYIFRSMTAILLLSAVGICLRIQQGNGFVRIQNWHRKAHPRERQSEVSICSRSRPYDEETKVRMKRNNRKKNGWKSTSKQRTKSPLTAKLQAVLDKGGSNIATVQIAEKNLLEHVDQADNFSFGIILKAYSRLRNQNNGGNSNNKKRTMNVAQKADELLHVMLKIPRLRADTYCYSAVLTAYARSGGGRRAALRAEELLHQLELSGVPINNDICYNIVMNCWASVQNDNDAGRRARVILTQLEENQKHGRVPTPTRVSYNSCLKALARSNDLTEVQQLFDQMKNNCDPSIYPDKISYATTIDAYCRVSSSQNETQAVEQVDMLLTEMESNANDDPSIRPDNYVYASVLSLYVKAGVDTARARGLLQRMKKYASEEPNKVFLNTLIHLFAKRHKSSDALALLETMKSNDMADKISYTSAISAMANVGNATEALLLFDELCDRYNMTGEERFLPTEKSFCGAMFALANGKTAYNTPIEKAEKLLHRMETMYNETNHPELIPTRAIYSTFFLFLSKVKDKNAPSVAQQLLREMKTKFEMGNHLVGPNSAVYVYVINFYTKFRIRQAAQMATKLLAEVEQGFDAGNNDLRPTKLLYSAVLQAYAKSASDEGADAAYALLMRCQKKYEEGKVYAKPTVLFYNAVMDAFARAGGEFVFRTEPLLNELYKRGVSAGDPERLPTIRSFNAVLMGWRNARIEDAPQRAEALLKRINEETLIAGLRPDAVTIHLVMGTWARSSQPKAAERSEEYLKLFFEGEEPVFEPNDGTAYNIVVGAYAHSSDPNSARKAEAVYERMKERYKSGENELKPSIVTLTWLRKAWSSSNDTEAPGKLKEIDELIELEQRK